MNVIPGSALIRKYEGNGPRYTSYPTALQFDATFGAAQHSAALLRSGEHDPFGPLSLYVHVPFCASPCYYCACTKVITRKPEHGAAYVDRLQREIALQAPLLPPGRHVNQLHFGGGTPTFLSPSQLQSIMDTLRRHFDLDTGAGREFSIEIDPRTVDPTALSALGQLGFNRASFGIQDFDPLVQQAVNRAQSPDQVVALMAAARAAGFRSLSVDLIYGLPLQTPASFRWTLDQVTELRPDRVSAYSYAHLPRRFVPQRQIRQEDLPDSEAKLELLQLTAMRLLDAGYVHIGMDHFALPGDELALALRSGTLQRNFQGYSTHGGHELLGLGMSAISRIGACYSQNARTLNGYYGALDQGLLAVDRGVALSADDLARRDVIGAIMCGGSVDYARIESVHELVFRDYFAPELEQLAAMADDRLVNLESGALRVTDIGRYLLRAVAMPFDAYLRRAASGQAPPQYSRLI